MNGDIKYLLKTVDRIVEVKNHYKDDKDLSRKLMVARQLIYDCAMQIPFESRRKPGN